MSGRRGTSRVVDLAYVGPLGPVLGAGLEAEVLVLHKFPQYVLKRYRRPHEVDAGAAQEPVADGVTRPRRGR